MVVRGAYPPELFETARRVTATCNEFRQAWVRSGAAENATKILESIRGDLSRAAVPLFDSSRMWKGDR